MNYDPFISFHHLQVKVKIFFHLLLLPHRYFLDRKEEGHRYFRIDESSGVVRTTQPLDREDMPWHNITVMASEVGR